MQREAFGGWSRDCGMRSRRGKMHVADEIQGQRDVYGTGLRR
jgi:hypothetical protein